MSNASSLQLLREPESEFSITKPLYEEAISPLDGSKSKILKLTGTAIVCDIPGINGRAYPKAVLKPEVDRFTEKYIKRGRSAAEMNHPRLDKSGDGKDYSVFEINLMKVCSIIELLKFNGDNLFCKMRVVDNHPAGEALKALIKAGYVPGYSLRGAGSVTTGNNGYYVVADDYRLITVDVVGNPSFDDKALIDAVYESIKGNSMKILTESVEFAQNQFLMECDYASKMKVGKKEFQRDAMIGYFESLRF